MLVHLKFMMRSRQHILRLSNTPATWDVCRDIHATIILPSLDILHLDIFELCWPFFYPSWSSLVV